MKQNFIPFTKASAMQMITRRMPGVHRKGFAAYKTDGEVTLSDISKQVGEYKEKQEKALKDAQDEVIRLTKEYTEKVTSLNEELVKKQATLGDIQKEVLELKAKAGRNIGGILGADGNPVNSFESLIYKSLEDNAEKLAKVDDQTPAGFATEKIGRQCKVKAAGTLTLANNVGSVSISGIPTIDQNIATRGHVETHFRDIFPIFDSATGSYVFYRANTPTGDGSVTFQTTHGAAKSQKDYDLTPVKVDAEFLAGYVDIARQALTDIPMLQSYVGNELIEDYLDTETFKMWESLLLQSNGPTVTPGAAPIETMIKSVAAMRQTKRGVNMFAMRPALWSQLLITKPADYSLPVNTVGVSPLGAVIVLGVPVYVTATNALTDAKFVTGDTRQAGIMQVTGEGLKVQVFTQHDKAVYNNIHTMRVEARVALLQRRLEAFSYQTA